MSELPLRRDKWPDLLLLVQSALNNSLSSQRKEIFPFTVFTEIDASKPISTFYRSTTSTTILILDIQRETCSYLCSTPVKNRPIAPQRTGQPQRKSQTDLRLQVPWFPSKVYQKQFFSRFQGRFYGLRKTFSPFLWPPSCDKVDRRPCAPS